MEDPSGLDQIAYLTANSAWRKVTPTKCPRRCTSTAEGCQTPS